MVSHETGEKRGLFRRNRERFNNWRQRRKESPPLSVPIEQSPNVFEKNGVAAVQKPIGDARQEFRGDNDRPGIFRRALKVPGEVIHQISDFLSSLQGKINEVWHQASRLEKFSIYIGSTLIAANVVWAILPIPGGAFFLPFSLLFTITMPIALRKHIFEQIGLLLWRGVKGVFRALRKIF